METEYKPNKHLTHEERDFIELGLEQGKNFTEIAKDINKDRRTISREVQKHRFRRNLSGFNTLKNLCKNRQECKKFGCTKENPCYEEEICFKIIGAHMYVTDVNKREIVGR